MKRKYYSRSYWILKHRHNLLIWGDLPCVCFILQLVQKSCQLEQLKLRTRRILGNIWSLYEQPIKIFIPSYKWYSNLEIPCNFFLKEIFYRTYYFYEFGLDKQHVALMATVNSGKVLSCPFYLHSFKQVLSPANVLLYVSWLILRFIPPIWLHLHFQLDYIYAMSVMLLYIICFFPTCIFYHYFLRIFNTMGFGF